MNTKLKGTYFYTQAYPLPPETDLYSGFVDDCMLSPGKLSLDYHDEHDFYHIEASSRNDFLFQGSFTCKQDLEETGEVILRHFRHGSSHFLFYGRWISGGQQGIYLFDLSLDDEEN